MKTRSLAMAAARAAACVRILFAGLLLGASGAVLAETDAERIPQLVKAAGGSGMSVSHAWGRATPAGVAVGAAYFTVVNHGNQSDTLVAVTSPVATRAELHRTTTESGLARMRPAGQIVLTPGQTLKAEPGSLHLMLTGLDKPLVAGTSVPLVLHFRQAGAITVQMDVLPATSATHDAYASH